MYSKAYVELDLPKEKTAIWYVRTTLYVWGCWEYICVLACMWRSEMPVPTFQLHLTWDSLCLLFTYAHHKLVAFRCLLHHLTVGALDYKCLCLDLHPSWRFDSGPHIWSTRTLPTELFSQPGTTTFYDKICRSTIPSRTVVKCSSLW